MSYISLLSIITILMIINEINCVYFNFTVKPGKEYCIGEYLTEDTVAIFAMSTDLKHVLIKLNDPQGKNLYTKNQLDVRVSLTATESGNHEMCIKNYDRSEGNVQFEFLSGIQAQDTSEIAKESSIQPAEAAIVRLKDMSRDLINDLSSVVKEEDKNFKVDDAISSKITIVSLITILVMIAVGVVETIYIKKYLQNRKLI